MTDQLLIREIINAALASLELCFFVIFVLYLWDQMFPPGEKRGWYNKIENKGAVALAVFFLAEAMRKTAVAFLLLDARETPPEYLPTNMAFSIVVTGFILATIGGLCIIRVFAKPEYKNVAWVLTLVVMIVAGSAAYILQI